MHCCIAGCRFTGLSMKENWCLAVGNCPSSAEVHVATLTGAVAWCVTAICCSQLGDLHLMPEVLKEVLRGFEKKINSGDNPTCQTWCCSRLSRPRVLNSSRGFQTSRHRSWLQTWAQVPYIDMGKDAWDSTLPQKGIWWMGCFSPGLQHLSLVGNPFCLAAQHFVSVLKSLVLLLLQSFWNCSLITKLVIYAVLFSRLWLSIV